MKKHPASVFLLALVLSSGNFSGLAAEGDASPGAAKAISQELPLAVMVDLKPRLDGYLKLRNEQLSVLAAKYGRVLDTRLNQAADGGDLKTVDAFRSEKGMLEALQKVIGTQQKDSVAAVRAGVALPDLAAGSPQALVELRKIWTAERVEIMGKVDAMLQQSLTLLESDLTKKRDFDNAKAVLAFRESLPGATAGASVAKAMEKKIGVAEPVTAGTLTESAIKVASKEKPFVNSLKMQFVPVKITGGPTRGRTVLFSVWETRKSDYEAFIKKDRDRAWPGVPFDQKDDHPALNVSWDDAVAFCAWLTKKERDAGKLGEKEEYRLPLDHEWSCAVGIGKLEDGDASPVRKNHRVGDEFPWGKGFPPPKGSGNYRGQESEDDGKGRLPDNDGFEKTAPVGEFKANELGLYDMGGNVAEWCQDWMDPQNEGERVIRGSHYGSAAKGALESSERAAIRPDRQSWIVGFRVVIARER
jgi:formylglycine-generating enzyme required for sulfatase activity